MGNGPERALRFLLRLFPEEFRAEFGDEMAAAFRAERRRAGGWRFWVDALRDFSLAAVQEHWTMTLTDLRVSARRQMAQPGFTLVAILSLALGIGANTAIFSILYGSVLQKLPVRDVDRVVMFEAVQDGKNTGIAVYSADFVDWRERARSFSQMEMMTGMDRVTVAGGGGAYPERIGKQNVTPGYFSLLGVQPLRGRLFTEEEARRGEKTAVLSESYWKRRYGGDPAVLGQTMVWGGQQSVIVGIVPAAHRLGPLTHGVDFWIPINLTPGSEWVQRKVRWMMAVGRLKDGVTLAGAQAEMRSLAAQLEQEYPVSNRKLSATVEPIQDVLTVYMRSFLVPLAGAAAFVLLIACLNVANLLLARAATRRRELALRAALGAGRTRLLREMLADGVVLAAPGVLLGIGVAWGGIRFFLHMWGEFAYAERVALHWPALIFAVVAGTATALFASLLPAWQASKTDVMDAMKDGGRGMAGGTRNWVRNGLVVAEIGMAVMLLMGAGLMLHTVQRLQGESLGFKAEGLATMRVDLAGPRYAISAPTRDMDMRYVEPATYQLYSQLLEEVRALGWAKDAVLASSLPMVFGGGGNGAFRIAGKTDDAPAPAVMNCVSDGYFSLLGIPVVKGRGIGAQDQAGGQWVAVINQTAADKYFAGVDPVGQYLTVASTEEERPRLIVGVVASHKRFGPKADLMPEVYMSFAQQPRLIPGNYQAMRLRPVLAVRTGVELHAVEDAVRQILLRLDPSLPIYNVKMLQDYVVEASRLEWILLRLLGVFGGLAVVLAAIGVFGLMHYSVAERTQEIGIRVALGAQAGQVVRMVLRQGVLLTLAGLALGACGAAMGTRLIERYLYGAQGLDLGTAGGVAVLMTAVALAACLIPARRAVRVDPVTALRAD